MKKRALRSCLAVALMFSMVCAWWLGGPSLAAEGAQTITAHPTTANIAVMNGNSTTQPDLPYGPGTSYRILNDIPVYMVYQSNGYPNSYVKLRDICYALNICVKWDAAEPNAMRIYTNRKYNHFADQQVYKADGVATQVKDATWSTMDLYVNDVKVDNVKPIMIEYNNYFKLRELAEAVDFGCTFFRAGYELPNRLGSALQAPIIGITMEFPYRDDDPEFMDADDYAKLPNAYSIKSSVKMQEALKAHQASHTYYPAGSRRTIVYEKTEAEVAASMPKEEVLHRPTYGYPSGEILDEPITITEDMPWARENYFDKYASNELKKLLGYDASSDSKEQIKLERDIVAQFNAVVQMLLDQDKIGGLRRQPESYDTELGFIKGNKYIKAGNPNYCYPQVKWKGGFVDSLFGMRPVSYSGYSTEVLVRTQGAWPAEGGQVQAKLESLNTDRERIQYLAELVCRKMEYAGAGSAYLEMSQKLDSIGVGVYGGVSEGYYNTDQEEFWADFKKMVWTSFWMSLRSILELAMVITLRSKCSLGLPDFMFRI